MMRARASASATREVSIVIQRRPHCSMTPHPVLIVSGEDDRVISINLARLFERTDFSALGTQDRLVLLGFDLRITGGTPIVALAVPFKRRSATKPHFLAI